MRNKEIKTEVLRLLHEVPFRPFVMTLENRQRVEIGHPENIAFDPEPNGATDFYAFSGATRLFSTFEAVTSVSIANPSSANGDEETQTRV
jgi:hypothetical protein